MDDWCSDQPKASGQSKIDAWFVAESKRRGRFERVDPLEAPTAFERDLRELRWDVSEKEERLRLRRLERAARIGLAQLTSTLDSPVTKAMLPSVLITPDGRYCCSVDGNRSDSRWTRRVNSTIDQYRGGHCVVEAECRC